MIPKLAKEEVIKNLNIVINGLTTIKDKINRDEFVSKSDWVNIAEPFSDCMSYLLNYQNQFI